MRDLRSRVTDDVFDLTTDGYQPYRNGAVYRQFRFNVNYGTEIKKYSTLDNQKGERRYSPIICTSCKRSIFTGSRITDEITVTPLRGQWMAVGSVGRFFKEPPLE